MGSLLFDLSVYFLTRFNQSKKSKNVPVSTVQDGTIYEDALYFLCGYLYKSKLLTKPRLLNYKELFDSMIAHVKSTYYLDFI